MSFRSSWPIQLSKQKEVSHPLSVSILIAKENQSTRTTILSLRILFTKRTTSNKTESLTPYLARELHSTVRRALSSLSTSTFEVCS